MARVVDYSFLVPPRVIYDQLRFPRWIIYDLQIPLNLKFPINLNFQNRYNSFDNTTRPLQLSSRGAFKFWMSFKVSTCTSSTIDGGERCVCVCVYVCMCVCV